MRLSLGLVPKCVCMFQIIAKTFTHYTSMTTTPESGLSVTLDRQFKGINAKVKPALSRD